MDNVVILPESKVKELFKSELEAVLKDRIPAIIRQANRKPYLTTAELEELTGMSSPTQKYHRDSGNLPYSQEGRRILYRTEDVEKFLSERRVQAKELV